MVDDDDERWWRFIDEAFPSTERLTAQLRALERDDLLDFAGFVAESRSAVRAPWEGPFIDEATCRKTRRRISARSPEQRRTEASIKANWWPVAGRPEVHPPGP